MAGLLVDRFSHNSFVLVTGPRGAGKTTLCRDSLPHVSYVNLELPEQRVFATQDPNGFLASLGNRAIVDEIQRAPNLIPYFHARAAEERFDSRFILTSSETSAIIERMNESLTGRCATLCLLPLTWKEREEAGASDVLNDALYSGFYPRIYEEAIAPRQALSDYFASFLDRGVLRIGGVRDLANFDLFTRLCAGRISRTIDLVALGRDAGVSHTTARNWLRILESSFIVFRLPPIQANTRKRLVKSPKLYFYDVGLAAYLMGIETSDQITTHPLRSALFENMVIAEALKHRYNKGRQANLTFFLDNHGLECELLFGLPSAQAAFEIRSSATILPDAFDSLNAIKQALPDVQSKHLIYGGAVQESEGDVEIVPFELVSATLDGLEIDRDTASVEESRIVPTISNLDSTRLNDAYIYWIKPLIQSLTTSIVEFQTIFGSISQLEFVEYGQNQVIAPTLFAADAWETTKIDHLSIALDELSDKEPLRLVHQTTLTGFTASDNGELALEIRFEWTLSSGGLKQAVSIDGEYMRSLDSEIVAYENLAELNSTPERICAEVVDQIKARMERHMQSTS